MTKIESFFVSRVGVSFFKVFILLIALFFIWGFSLGLLDILTENFKSVIQSNASMSGLILLTYYAGYFLMPLPISIFTDRFGYKYGVIFGLLVFALGAFMFLPNSYFQSSSLFLFSMFCIALGMGALETVVNPYTTLVGKNNLSAFRITLGHSFTSLGWFFGPFVAASILLEQKQNANQFELIQLPYVGVGILVVFVAILLSITELPKIKRNIPNKSIQLPINQIHKSKSIFRQRHFVFAIVAMFFYTCAQSSLFHLYPKYLFDFFKSMETNTVLGQEYILNIVRYIGASDQINDKLFLTVSGLIFSFLGLGLFTLGRFVGSFILIKIKTNTLLLITSLFSLLFTILIWMNFGIISLVALCLMTLSISVMFPLIFSLGIRKMGNKTNRASAYIIMAITGGSIYPFLINVYDSINPVRIGIVLLMLSFLIIFLYAFNGHKIGLKNRDELKLYCDI